VFFGPLDHARYEPDVYGLDLQGLGAGGFDPLGT
jgi:hypothetical protein